MNAEAIKECERLSGELGVTKELIAAMRWAYADAAKVCRSKQEAYGAYPDRASIGEIAEAIEGRAR